MNFRGKNFCISGFDSTNEDDVKTIIEKVGGVLRSSAVKDLDYLIYHPQFGIGTKKYQKAKELKLNGRNVEILSIFEFVELVKKGL